MKGTEIKLGYAPTRRSIFSGAGKVECLGSLSPAQEKFLKQYYAGRVAFAAR